MSYSGYITKLKNVRKHPNADNLNIAECFGNQVIVGINSYEGEPVVYFPSDGQLGIEYCIVNNLIVKKDEFGKNIGGYLDPKKRNIRALKLRGEISDGLALNIKSLESFTDISSLKSGDCVDVFNGIVIAQKYIPITTTRTTDREYSKKSKKTTFRGTSYPLFKEHIDTSQYAYNKHVFRAGDIITITLKMHGTSHRTAKTKKIESIKPTKLNLFLAKLRLKKYKTESIEVVSGTRRTVIESFNTGGGYYGDNAFRKPYHDDFAKKLKTNETVYFEIVGFLEGGKTIMSTQDNKKTNDKEFIKKYGDKTVFSYGCNPSEGRLNDAYVYRMTFTNDDGEVFEYPTWLIQKRCEEMGVKFVPVLDQFIFTTLEDLEERVDRLSDGEDPIGKTHIREGVVIRVENSHTFKAYKNKNFHFKCIESLIKDSGVLDMEEVESLPKGE